MGVSRWNSTRKEDFEAPSNNGRHHHDYNHNDDEEEEHDVVISPSNTNVTTMESFDSNSPTKTPTRGSNKKNNKGNDGTSIETLSNIAPMRSIDIPNTTRSTLTIEHVDKKARGRNQNRSLMAMTAKPMMVLMGLGVVGTGGYAGYQWLSRIPGLQDQIKELELQVDRLENEVDRLEIQNDRLEGLNDDLNATVIEFANLNDQFNLSNIIYDGLNDDFNTSILVLKEHIIDLQVENEYYKALNVEFNVSIQELTNDVDRLENTTALLEIQNGILNETRMELAFEVGKLQQSNNALNATVMELERIYGNLQGENEQLRELNNDLTAITQFLNETSGDIEQSYASMTSYLADLIDRNEYLLVEDLHIKYEQKLTNWDCNFIDRFRTKDFVYDWTLPVLGSYSSVVTYLNEQLFTEVCLSLSDFEAYLVDVVIEDDIRSVSPPTNVTVNEIISGVRSYTSLAFDYYFPDPTDGEEEEEDGNSGSNNNNYGLSVEAWTDIHFRCENLSEDQQFLYQSVFKR